MSARLERVAVVTGDVIGSSHYSGAVRRRVDRTLRAAFREAGRRFPGAFQTSLSFRVTAGDEFQCVIADVAQSLHILTYARAVAASADLTPPLRFRAAIGVGSVSVPAREGKSSYEQDGIAFVRARRGLETITERGHDTTLLTGDPLDDKAAEALLGLMDHLSRGWTIAQWEAVRWSILGRTRKEIGRAVNIAHQNVTKRLHAAGWAPFDAALAFLAARLETSDGTRLGVQRPVAPS